MANNPYVNKVQTADGTTIIDISDTTAVAADVATGKYFYTAAGQKVQGTASGGGGGAAISITDTLDANGGTIRTITAVDISSDTVTAAHLESGYTAHDAAGNAITGELSPGGGGTYQAKTNIDPTENSQTVTPDTGYDALSSVQINGISSSYVGSAINRRDSTDLTANGATVTAPAGYYASDATKSVASGSATAPASISGSSASVSTGTNTITLTKTVSVTPNVTTAGYISSGTAGNSDISLTASVTTKAAATITPTKSTQTIASGTYLTGTQTIAAIPAAYQDVTGVTAAAGDVVSGKDIVNSSGTVVHGSLVIQHYYTGSSAPSSATGVNGDIYLQT